MGVTLVLSYPIPENKSCQQVLESLYKLMDILSAKKCGTYKIDCETFVSAPHIQPPKVLQTFHDTEKPLTTFASIDNGNHYLIADSINFDIILTTYFDQIYPSRKQQKFECSGIKFELCEADFIVRIGQVLQEQYIIIEIEYTPCLIPSNCWDIILQLANNFISSSPPVPTCDSFRPIDTIKQYQHIFNTLRKKTN